MEPEESIDDSYPPSSQKRLSIDDSCYPPSSQVETEAINDSESGPSYTPGGSPPPTDHPLLSEASSAESRDDSLTDLNQSKPDLSQSIDLDKCKNTNFFPIVNYALNAAEDEPLSSLQSSQSDVEDTEGRSPKIPIMYKEVVIPSDSEEVEEFLTEQKSSRKHVTPLSTLKLNLNNNENNNETPARKHFIPQSCKSLNRRNRWAHSDFSEDDDSDYDPDKDIGTRLTPPNLGFSSDSNTDSDDHSEGPAKKKMKKSLMKPTQTK